MPDGVSDVVIDLQMLCMDHENHEGLFDSWQDQDDHASLLHPS